MTAAAALVFAAVLGQPNGSIEYAGPVRVVNLWGSWGDMGYAEGYLLGPEIMDLYEVYLVELAGGTGGVETARRFVGEHFPHPLEFRKRASGMLAGMADTCGLYSSVFGRDLDTLDVYVAASAPDLSDLMANRFVSCSSTSAWGDATAADPVLGGDPAMSRNLDYFIDTGSVLLDHQVLFTLDPEIPKKLKRLVLMGGLFGWGVSGCPREWNILCDPIAASIVFKAPVSELIAIGLDVTLQCRMPAADCIGRFNRIGGPLAVVAAATEVWGQHTNQVIFHDPLAGAVAFKPELCQYQAGRVEVELKSDKLAGATLFDRGSPEKSHQIAQAVNAPGFFEEYFAVTSGKTI